MSTAERLPGDVINADLTDRSVTLTADGAPVAVSGIAAPREFARIPDGLHRYELTIRSADG